MPLPVSKRFLPDVALGFGDVLLEPAATQVSAQQTSLTSLFSPGIELKMPFVTNCTDLDTRIEKAIFFARLGGIAILPHDISISRQADMVRKIKRFQSRVVRNVITATPDMFVAEAMEYRQRHGISCLPLLDPATRQVTKIILLDDAFMALEPDAVLGDVAIGDAPVTIDEKEIDQARARMREQDVSLLIVVDARGQCVGLISKDDLDNIDNFPLATLDTDGSLRVAASVGSGEEHYDRVSALMEAGVDAIVVDAMHAHTKATCEMVTYIRRQRAGHVDVIAGNVMTAQAVMTLIDAGANALKVGVGGASHENMLAPGVGVPQFTALLHVGEAGAINNMPIIANGGVFCVADCIKAFAAGATVLSVDALLGTSQDTAQREIDAIADDLRCAMAYTGCATLKEFNSRPRFIPISRNF